MNAKQEVQAQMHWSANFHFLRSHSDDCGNFVSGSSMIEEKTNKKHKILTQATSSRLELEDNYSPNSHAF